AGPCSGSTSAARCSAGGGRAGGSRGRGSSSVRPRLRRRPRRGPESPPLTSWWQPTAPPVGVARASRRSRRERSCAASTGRSPARKFPLMPELPEVEIASRQLRHWLLGKRIARARAERTRVIRGQGPQRFAALAGHALSDIERFGKWMLLSFDGGEGLLSHLGMTGKWIRRRPGEDAPSHVRATLQLDDGSAIDYRDPRLFGRLVRGKTAA